MIKHGLKFWHYGLAVTLLISGLGVYSLEFSDKKLFISGNPSHGHHQIEMACKACHVDGFGGADDMQHACLNCHGKELEQADDSHPRKKFLDPRNAPLLADLDARRCATCHTEHKPEITRNMGVTLAGDFCVHCHGDIGKERDSHADFAFDSCSDCHNYHDNRTLHEDFLIARLDDPNLLKDARLPPRDAVQTWQSENPNEQPLRSEQADLPAGGNHHVVENWADSAHAQVAVNCGDCHADSQTRFTSAEIVEQCGSCHQDQRKKFTEGKHGMRLSAELPEDFAEGAMSPREARRPMNDHARDELNCASCHDPHQMDLQAAATEACLNCHDDEHSVAYKESPHFRAWQEKPLSSPSCAGCHLPRERQGERIVVNHNQNHNLRPNDKMVPVCLDCHGVEFALAALVDEDLITSNFASAPASEHKTFELIRDRARVLEQADKNQ